MATNQILPFGIGAGANVLAFADYSALPARQSGFQAGTALSVQLNTAWRQSAFVASMLAQFTSDLGGYNVLDDGVIANIQGQFSSVIRAQALNYRAGGGTATAITLTLSPTPASYTELIGAPLRVRIPVTNTGAATLNVNGLGAKSILRADGSALQAGDLVVGEIVPLVYDGTQFQIEGYTSSGVPARNIQRYTTPGSYTFTVPAGVYFIFAEVQGGGGGGGGVTGAGGTGGGGGGGGYAEGWYSVTPGQQIAVTVGAGGTAGTAAGANGGTGGSSSLGALLSATGGTGGATQSSTAGTGGTGTGGQRNITGGNGYPGLYIGGDSTKPHGGAGAPSYRSSVVIPFVNGGAVAGFGAGSGGSGAGYYAAAAGGGAGAAGQVTIQY